MQLGWPRQTFDVVDSTNRVALDWLDAPVGALITAKAQSAGRGRLGRHWESPAGKGLYFSLVLRPEELAPARYALLAGLGVTRALEGEVSALVRCKWPNDILCNGKKIGGILCETRDERLIVGIGLNLSHAREELPARPIFPASSLLLETGTSPDAETLLPLILRSLEATFVQTEWRDDYEQRMWGLGEIARNRALLGVVDGIENDGRLRLKTADGPSFVVAGEMEWI